MDFVEIVDGYIANKRIINCVSLIPEDENENVWAFEVELANGETIKQKGDYDSARTLYDNICDQLFDEED